MAFNAQYTLITSRKGVDLTTNQIAWLSAVNQAHHDQQVRVETNRSNLAREAETTRHNVATEREQNRSNLAQEGIALFNAKENQRANLAREQETYRSNLAREQETARSNRANESIKREANDIAIYGHSTNYSAQNQANKIRQEEVNAKKPLYRAQTGATELQGSVNAAKVWNTMADTNLKKSQSISTRKQAEASQFGAASNMLGAVSKIAEVAIKLFGGA